MAEDQESAAPRPASGCLAAAVALGPAVFVAAASSEVLLRFNRLSWGPTDSALVGLAGLCFVGALLLRRRAEALKRLSLLAFSLLAFVPILGALRPPVPDGLPAPPRSYEAEASDAMPGIEGTIRYSVNALGLRGDQGYEDPAALKLLCVGGSTTECLYVTDDKTWPARLQVKLGEALKRPVFVGNAGRSGHIARHHGELIARYKTELEFDGVIVLVGINDVGTLLRDNYADRVERAPYETLTGDLAAAPITFYRRSPIFRALEYLLASSGSVRQDLEGRWHDTVRALRRERLKQRALTEAPDGLGEALERYRADIDRVIAACEKRGWAPFFLTQPTLYHPGMKPELAALLWQHSDDAAASPELLFRLNRAFNEALLERCRQRKVPCFDLDKAMAKDDSVFYDDCHYTAAGCERVAESVAGAALKKWLRPR